MRHLYACLLLCLALPAAAGGSFSVDGELMPIVRPVPGLWEALARSFEMPASGWANRIGTPVNADLGGRRIGPYCLPAKPKGSKGPDTFEICFNTEATFLDAKGKPTSLEKAKSVREAFASVEIKPMAAR